MATYAGNADNYPANAAVTADGDYKRTSSVRVAQENVLDRAAYLRKRQQYTEVNEFIRFPLSCALPGNPNRWVAGGLIASQGLTQESAAAAYIVRFELDLPKYGVLKDVSCTLVGAPGHAALPATMPRLQLLKQSLTVDGAPTSLGDVPDGSATIGVYHGLHAISITGLAELLQSSGDFRYYLQVVGETGANSVAGLVCTSIHGHFDPTP